MLFFALVLLLLYERHGIKRVQRHRAILYLLKFRTPTVARRKHQKQCHAVPTVRNQLWGNGFEAPNKRVHKSTQQHCAVFEGPYLENGSEFQNFEIIKISSYSKVLHEISCILWFYKLVSEKLQNSKNTLVVLVFTGLQCTLHKLVGGKTGIMR